MTQRYAVPGLRSSRRRLTVRLLLLVIGVSVAGGAVALFVGARENKALAVADQLQVPASWVRVSESVEPPRVVCLGDNPCPSVSRQWQVSRDLSVAEMRSLAERAGWEVSFDGSCGPRS